MFGQHTRHAVQQTHAVAGRNVEQPALALLVGLQVDSGRDRKTLDAPRHPAATRCRQRAGLCDGVEQLGLYHAGQFVVVVRHGLGDNLKRVKRVGVVGGVDAGIQNAEAALVKVAANARKQVGLVRCVDQHLQAFTQR